MSAAPCHRVSSILVVDDEELMRTTLVRILATLGYHSVTAANGVEALEAMEHHHFDLIITDMVMPVMDGLTLIQEIRSRGWDVAIMLMSGYSVERCIQQAHQIGIQSFLPKPFDLETLKRYLAAVGLVSVESAFG